MQTGSDGGPVTRTRRGTATTGEFYEPEVTKTGLRGLTMHNEPVPPTQYLTMEVLAARWRLGEKIWTFPGHCRPALRSLADKNWVGHKNGVLDGTELAWLTAEGITAWDLDKPWRSTSDIPQPNAPTMNLLAAERDTVWGTIRSRWQVRN